MTMGNMTLFSLVTLLVATGLAGWFVYPVGLDRAFAEEPAALAPLDTEALPIQVTPTAEALRGSLVIAGGGALPNVIYERFLELGGGDKASLVIIPSASVIANSPDVLERLPIWKQLHPGPITVLHAETREKSCEVGFCKPLETATAVWFIGGDQNLIAERYLGTPVEPALHRVLERGGVIGGTSAGAAIMSRVMIAGGRTTPMMATGLGFLPNTIVDQHFLKRNRKDRLHAALKLHPQLVGVGIDEDTALVCRPEGYEVIGNSSVLLCLGATANRKEITEALPTGQKFDLRPWTVAAAGRARHGAYTIAAARPIPNLRKGAVVIAGPRPPKEAVQEFLTAAGGKDANLILVSENKEAAESESRLREYFAEMGAENLMVCSATDADTLSDPKTHETFARAQGVWFVGAEEERLLDLVVRSSLQKVVGDVLARGGAIGGSSAGARIHGDGIVRRKSSPAVATTVPENSHDSGLGLLTGVVIDQCAENEESASSMASVLRDRFPNCIGLGLNESAAVVVRGHTMQVVGREPVSIYDNTRSDVAIPADQKVPAGQTYDFLARRVVETAVESATR